MSDEIVKYSNQFNAQALRKFTALDLDLLMAIASRVRDKGTDEVVVAFEELRRLSGLQKNLTNAELEDRIIQVNSRLLALNFMFKDGRKTIQFPPLFAAFETDPDNFTLLAAVNSRFSFLLSFVK